MSTTFISHRMFVAALNHERPVPAPDAGRPQPHGSSVSAPRESANQLTVEELAAFAARHWPEFPFVNGMKQSVS